MINRTYSGKMIYLQHSGMATAFFAVVAICIASCASAYASKLKLEYNSTLNRSGMFFGPEFASLSGRAGALYGTGVRVGWEYDLSNRLSLATSMGMTGLLRPSGHLYTGINSIIAYSIFGSLISQRLEIKNHGVTVISSHSPMGSCLTIGLGAEELFLSGSSAALPFFGLIGEVSYRTTIFSQWIRFSARYGNFAGAGSSAPGMMFNLYFLLR